MVILLKLLVVSLLIHLIRGFSMPTEVMEQALILEPYSEDISKSVTLNLFTPETPDKSFDVTVTSALKAPFKIEYSTEVIIHGYLENDDQKLFTDIKDAYFERGCFNVITVDWSKLATQEYSVSARKTKAVGEYVGKVLKAVVDAGLITFNNIHCIGFSLGAQVAAFIGQYIICETGLLIGRITALDAASPLFERPNLVSSNMRLTKDDATFVMAIHTAGGTNGFKSPLGHADFFPNGGNGNQPGCEIGPVDINLCDHFRAAIFYAISINNNKFISTSCSSFENFKEGKCAECEKVPMGFDTPATARGNYYLFTNPDKPYAQG